MNANDSQLRTDADYLNMLRICYWIMAGLQAVAAVILAACAVLMGGVLGASIGDPAAGGLIFVVYGAMALLTAGIAFLNYQVGKNLASRRGRGLAFAAAILLLFSFPLGTLLGIFTLVVLNRPTVAQSFNA